VDYVSTLRANIILPEIGRFAAIETARAAPAWRNGGRP
jgi:hypothetical protein